MKLSVAEGCQYTLSVRRTRLRSLLELLFLAPLKQEFVGDRNAKFEEALNRDVGVILRKYSESG